MVKTGYLGFPGFGLSVIGASSKPHTCVEAPLVGEIHLPNNPLLGCCVRYCSTLKSHVGYTYVTPSPRLALCASVAVTADLELFALFHRQSRVCWGPGGDGTGDGDGGGWRGYGGAELWKATGCTYSLARRRGVTGSPASSRKGRWRCWTGRQEAHNASQQQMCCVQQEKKHAHTYTRIFFIL